MADGAEPEEPTPVAAVLAEAGNAPDTSPSATAAAEADVVSLRQESAAAAATDGAGQPTDGVTPPSDAPAAAADPSATPDASGDAAAGIPSGDDSLAVAPNGEGQDGSNPGVAAAATAAAVGPARGEAGEEGGEPALAGNGKSGDGDSSSAAEAEEAVAAAAAAAAAAEGAKPGGRRKRLVVVVEELPPLPEGYVPVAMLPPLPLPYCMDEATGKPEPLPGVICVFMTSTTVDMLGISFDDTAAIAAAAAAAAADPNAEVAPPKRLLYTHLTKEKVLSDIQFRGAISDLHPFKPRVVESELDVFMVRQNEDDIYGDGSNYEVALSRSAAEAWRLIEGEATRRVAQTAMEEHRAAVEGGMPKGRRARVAKAWVSLGSEVEIEESTVRSKREPIRMALTCRRRDFNQAFQLGDKDAHELWNSSQMECRPFKDPNFDLRKLEQDVGVQAVAAAVDVAVQAGSVRPRPQTTQTAPQDMSAEEKAAALRSPELASFLDRVRDQCEAALIQNEVVDIFTDDLAALAEEDGLSGNRKESMLSESQSFTHLTYSKNKVVSAIQWLPHRKGVVAVATTETMTHSERVARAGRPTNAHILIWNFKDPIHPEYVLQAPFEVFSFAYNPANPELIAGGCYNGQVVVWDTTHEHERIGKMKESSRGEGDASDDAAIPVVKYRYLSDIQFSHNSHVTDLQWLPGIELSSRGRLSTLPDGPREAAFFCTVASDGKIYFWDVRVDRLMKKGRKGGDDPADMVWKPTHSVHLISLLGMDLGGVKCCFNFNNLDSGLLSVGSFDGELVLTDFVKPEGEDNPDYMKSCLQAHVGPITSLERSPFFDDVILTVGDWSFQIWREGQPKPLFQSGYAAEYYTTGCWSPTRPAVVYLADIAGGVEVWDLVDRSHEPSIKVMPASTPIMSMCFNSAAGGSGNQQQQAANQLLALGDSAGVLRILELPRNLRRPLPNEKRLMAAFLARETDRVQDVGARGPARLTAKKAWEERRKASETEAEKKANEGAADKAERPASLNAHASPDASLPGTKGKGRTATAALLAGVELDERAEAAYLALEHKFKVQLGLIDVGGKV
ncbi:MAG: hypothetical protein WDW36_004270 [Sanguina aurantia]